MDESPLKTFWARGIDCTSSSRDEYAKGYNAGLQWEHLVWHDPKTFSADYQMGFADGKGDMVEWTGRTLPARIVV